MVIDLVCALAPTRIQSGEPVLFGGSQDGFRGTWEQGMNFYCLTLKDGAFLQHFQEGEFDVTNPYKLTQSIKTVYTLGVGNYGDSSKETETLCKDFFAFSDRHTGDNAEPLYIPKLNKSVMISVPLTLDKSAGWKALGCGGAGDCIRFWDLFTAHIQCLKGCFQPFICTFCKHPDSEYCTRIECSCREDKKPCDSPCIHSYVSLTIYYYSSSTS